MCRTVRPLAAAVAVAALLVPPGGALQVPVDSIREMVEEFTELEARFERVQDEALERFPELRERQDRLGALVERVMDEIDPGVLDELERLERHPVDLDEARRARNAHEVQRLVIEGERIRQRVAVARAAAMAEPEVFEAVQAYRAELLRRMQEVDPGILAVMVRADELKERLREAGGLAERVAAPDGDR